MAIRADLKTDGEWALVAGLLDEMGKHADTDRISRELQKYRDKRAEKERRIEEARAEKEKESLLLSSEEQSAEPENKPAVIEKPTRQKPPVEYVEKPVRKPVTEVPIEKPTRQKPKSEYIMKPVRQRPTQPVIEKPTRQKKSEPEYIIKPQRRKDE